ncbi:MAG: transposase [Aphanothece sp. CMT-3BRIN-NPC111]|nr:transposase [Aphanothece sp. CMT-3BRIN-NPC111]
MDVSVRAFDCPHCGQKHDRDVNAAINTRNEGLRLLALGISEESQSRERKSKGFWT